MIYMFYSQGQQDEWLELIIFKGYKHGVFMDVGAHDGVDMNNTLYFEKNNQWTGVNIEANKSVFDKLVINRPTSININCAAYNENGETDFICNSGYTEMLSGIKNTFDPIHYDRLQQELRQKGGTSKIIRVPTKKIETICDEHNIKHINYLSIDVEGAEFEVIKSINFDNVFIDVIGFENNYDEISEPIIKYLENNNYRVINKFSDIFMIHNDSDFYKNN